MVGVGQYLRMQRVYCRQGWGVHLSSSQYTLSAAASKSLTSALLGMYSFIEELTKMTNERTTESARYNITLAETSDHSLLVPRTSNVRTGVHSPNSKGKLSKVNWMKIRSGSASMASLRSSCVKE